MRLFLAISISSKFRGFITNVQKKLTEFDKTLTWVKPSQAHITLRFLGDQPEEKLIAIIRYSKDIVAVAPEFELGDMDFKLFPNSKNPRALLFDFQEGKKEFLDLQKRLDESLLKSGLIFKHPLVFPHLTIGRIKEKASPSQRQAVVLRLSDALAKPRRFRKVDLAVKVQKIHLIQSQLTPKGPIYRGLESFSLVSV
ncbi:MAG: 2'-5' RNA ligase [Parcubacteria group bacterium GW2011_GWA2_39_18]|nr:MAG: 2'-5' RNA ligase [Parcubacteria group bacterium GW2011_GWA2_39_18]